MSTNRAQPMSREAIEQRWERIAQLTREGRSAGEIAAIMGVSKRSVQRIREKYGISQGITFVPLSDDERRSIVAMLDDGCSYSEIARTLRRSAMTIIRHYPGRGWPPGEGARIEQLRRHAFARIERRSA